MTIRELQLVPFPSVEPRDYDVRFVEDRLS
jgi:hypothetical protein